MLFGVVVVVFVGIQGFFLTDIKHEYVSRNLSEHQKLFGVSSALAWLIQFFFVDSVVVVVCLMK